MLCAASQGPSKVALQLFGAAAAASLALLPMAGALARQPVVWLGCVWTLGLGLHYAV